MSASCFDAGKARFRALMRERVKRLDEEYIRASDEGIMKNVLALDAFVRARAVFAYCSVGRECATAGIISAAHDMGKTVALPRSKPGGVMDFASDEYGLHPAMYGIPEPAAEAEALSPQPGDIIIVPAVCCDVSGMRLGQGGGYYDRFLTDTPSVTACLCRARLLQEKVPAEWNDIRVNFVITEHDIIEIK